jgi:hypothetical protein
VLVSTTYDPSPHVFIIVKHVLGKKGEKGIIKKGTYMNWLIKVK